MPFCRAGACSRRKNIKTENAIDFLGCVFLRYIRLFLFWSRFFGLRLFFLFFGKLREFLFKKFPHDVGGLFGAVIIVMSARFFCQFFQFLRIIVEKSDFFRRFFWVEYGKRIASFSNMLGGGVLVQRFGDLVKGRRTNEKRMLKSFCKPTLSATPGDLSLVLPKRHLDDIIEMIYALDKIAPGMANADTLLYGVEVKFYSARLELDSNLETKVPNMFAVGDGAGITRGLSQASASGVWAARVIGRRATENK